MQYVLLVLVLGVSTVGAWAAFTDRVRQSSAYLLIAIGVSVATGLLFASGVRVLNDKPRIFMFSVYYDVVVALAYYVLPLALFGCRVNTGVILGSLVVLLGLLIMHMGE